MTSAAAALEQSIGNFLHWKLKTGGVIMPEERLPWGQIIIFGVQHVVAMASIGISVVNTVKLLDACFTTKAKGMGMGVLICNSIVEAHGGRLSFANDAGPGATFQFHFSIA
jgi:phosphoglycerate-specific signal transduction histidine kinase